MGNSASAGHQQSSSNIVVPNGREREHTTAVAASVGPDGRHNASARYAASSNSAPQQRIVVDIRSAQLDKDYKVYVRQEPRRDLDVELRSAWNGLQAVGGLMITILTIQKLWEDIRFIRLLRRELSSIVASLTDAGPGPDSAGDEAAGARAPRPGGSAPSAAASFGPAPGAGPSGRHLDVSLADLGDLLSGRRGPGGGEAGGGGASGGTGGRQQQAQAQANGGAGVVAHKETTWSSISGLTDVKILLQEATVLPTLRPDLFQGIRQPPKALLLFGPPGTGKTLLARAVATESRATFLPVTGSSVLSMWYGQSEQNVKALFEKARKRQPAIIFIDEVDSLLGKRSAGGPRDSTPDKRVTNEFLAFIDGIQTQQPGQQQQYGGGAGTGAGAGAGDDGALGDTRIVVIAATNTPWDLDEAALSRFSRRLYVPLPDKATREALMRRAMEGVTCDIPDSDWQRLAERCDKYSGRDLVQVCREAAMRPLRELWGRRLLEGSSPGGSRGTGPGLPGGTSSPGAPGSPQHAAAQQRLVDLVVRSLAGAAEEHHRSMRLQQQQGRQQRNERQQGGGSRGEAKAEAGGAAAADGAGKAAAPAVAGETSGTGGGAGRAVGAASHWRWRWGGLGGDRYSVCKKQARRELERWKRRHGASWCDIDAVMQQAEARLAEAAEKTVAAEAAETTVAAEAAEAEVAAEAAEAEVATEAAEAQAAKEAEAESREAQGAPEAARAEGARGQRQPQPRGQDGEEAHDGGEAAGPRGALPSVVPAPPGSRATAGGGAGREAEAEAAAVSPDEARDPPAAAGTKAGVGAVGGPTGPLDGTDTREAPAAAAVPDAAEPTPGRPGEAAAAGPGAADEEGEEECTGSDGAALGVPSHHLHPPPVEDGPAEVVVSGAGGNDSTTSARQQKAAPAAPPAAAAAVTELTAVEASGSAPPAGPAAAPPAAPSVAAVAPGEAPAAAALSSRPACEQGPALVGGTGTVAADGSPTIDALPAPPPPALPAVPVSQPAKAAAGRKPGPSGRSAGKEATASASSAPAGSASSASRGPGGDAGAAAGVDGSGTGAGSGPGPAALSLEDLLTLPVSRVRAVTALDMEAALQVITCTEMDQSARYTEWDEQYGSGANNAGRVGGGRSGRWMSMYA